jgi:nitrite reductase (cytochrome c-552)
MPYMREGATKVSDHWVRSPLLNVNRACQTCHRFSESELLARVDVIQTRNHDLLERGGVAIVATIDAIVAAKARGATPAMLELALKLQRKAQWRVDFIAAENSMGFHAPQESSRILGEAIDYARQGQIAAITGGGAELPPLPAPSASASASGAPSVPAAPSASAAPSVSASASSPAASASKR